jgi:hypothetical protein
MDLPRNGTSQNVHGIFRRKFFGGGKPKGSLNKSCVSFVGVVGGGRASIMIIPMEPSWRSLALRQGRRLAKKES